ncbi:MAG: YajQ family cyclic di-GMP-binding protein [Pseudomonadota bacterium]
MPSFDVVSEVDIHELTNAIDQASREISARYDFKGVTATFEFKEKEKHIMLAAANEYQLEQMLDMLRNKMGKRKIDISTLKANPVQQVGNKATLKCDVQQGLESETAKKIVKHIKESGIKVQASIQGDKLRVTGGKRDDLQKAIADLRQQDFGLPLQYNNFRD